MGPLYTLKRSNRPCGYDRRLGAEGREDDAPPRPRGARMSVVDVPDTLQLNLLSPTKFTINPLIFATHVRSLLCTRLHKLEFVFLFQNCIRFLQRDKYIDTETGMTHALFIYMLKSW